jgi:hypothetical protein
MIRDCRAEKPEGWSYFVTNFAPVVERLTMRYGGDFEGTLAAFRKPDSSPFPSLEPMPERPFIGALRQRILAAAPARKAVNPIPLDLETVIEALAPLTMVEKQAAWFETMHFTPQQTAEALRMAAGTVEKIRVRAGELLRGKLDCWRVGLLAENAQSLGLEAAKASTKDCLPSKTFLDILDGQSTWRDREEIERHVSSCWHCIDHFCRMAEVIELRREVKPLSESESAHLRKKLGIEIQKKPFWKR